MAVKQTPGSARSPDGSQYVVIADGAGNLTPNWTNAYPAGATAITGSATGTTGATAATLIGASGLTTYIAGFTITSDATAAAAGAAVVSGTVSNSMNFRMPTGATPAVGVLTQQFNPPVPASATNTSIVVTSAAPGAGGNIAVTAWGYRL